MLCLGNQNDFSGLCFSHFMVALQWFSGAALLAVSHVGRGFIDNTQLYGSFCRGEQGIGFAKIKKIRWTVDNTQTTFLKSVSMTRNTV